MRITTITYGFTKNLGNFQSERLDMTAEVDPHEDEQQVFNVLKTTVRDALDGKYDITISLPDEEESDW